MEGKIRRIGEGRGGRTGFRTDQGNVNTCGRKGKKGSSGGREGEV